MKSCLVLLQHKQMAIDLDAITGIAFEWCTLLGLLLIDLAQSMLSRRCLSNLSKLLETAEMYGFRPIDLRPSGSEMSKSRHDICTDVVEVRTRNFQLASTLLSRY